MAWAWATATRLERANWIRRHAAIEKPCAHCGRRGSNALTKEALCALFDLTAAELVRVLAGADYPQRS